MKANVVKVISLRQKNLGIGAICLLGLMILVVAGVGGASQAYGAPAAKKGGKNGAVREKYLSREQTVRSRDQTKLDFEAADIGGQRKAPLGSFLNQNRSDKEYDFVKIRMRWTPEMIQSSSSLDSGKAK